MPFRELTDYERRVIDKLLEGDFPGRAALSEQITNSLVRELDADGCLEFDVRTDVKAIVKDRIPTEGEYDDIDSITVHILLHVVDGKVNELEIYKDDGSQVIQMPAPTTLRLFRPG